MRLLAFADCKCSEVICGLLCSIQNFWGQVELIACSFDNICRSDTSVDVLEDGPLAFLVTRIYLLVGGTNVALDFLHLFVL